MCAVESVPFVTAQACEPKIRLLNHHYVFRGQKPRPEGHRVHQHNALSEKKLFFPNMTPVNLYFGDACAPAPEYWDQ